MVEVIRSWDELQQKINEVNVSLKNSQTELNGVKKGLQLDPGNVELISDKYKVFSEQLVINQEKSELLKEAIDTLNADLESGAISIDTYNSKLSQLQVQASVTESTIRGLSGAIEEVGEVADDVDFSSFGNEVESNGIQKLKDFKSALSSFQSAAKAAYSTIADWHNMNWFEQSMSVMSLAIAGVSAALAIFKVVSAGIAAPAVAGAIAAGIAAVGIGLGVVGALTTSKSSSSASEVVNATNQAVQESNKHTIDINVTVDTAGETPIDYSNALMISGLLNEQIRKDLVPYINEALGATNR